MKTPFINIRGTSGSGKSTIVQRIFSEAPQVQNFYYPGRKRPIYNILTIWDKSLAVMGHYETACGGCDTIGSLDEIFWWAKKAVEEHKPDAVLAEGLLLGKDTSRVVHLCDNSHIIALTTPMDVCYASVKARRIERAQGDPVKLAKAEIPPKALPNDYKSIWSAINRLKGTSVTIHECDREQAYWTIKKLVEGK